ncbi:MAG: acyloxyacyl hydrolase [Burkholderiales bacterium]
MRTFLLAALAGAALALPALPAKAVDSVSLELGTGDATDMGRIGLQWKWDSRWLAGGGWHLGGYWDAQLGYWKSRPGGGVSGNSIVDFGITPVFRYQRDDGRGFYVEGAIGFHYLSKKEINANRRFSTNFQFGDHVGAGFRFGGRNEWDASIRLQHLSNGSIKRPNPGINFLQLRLQHHF